MARGLAVPGPVLQYSFTTSSVNFHTFFVLYLLGQCSQLPFVQMEEGCWKCLYNSESICRTLFKQKMVVVDKLFICMRINY